MAIENSSRDDPGYHPPYPEQETMTPQQPIEYISTRGGITPVGFDTAVLEGFAKDGGLFVPNRIPRFSLEQLKAWKSLGFTQLAREVIRPFIPESLLPDADVKRLLDLSFRDFGHDDVLPVTTPDLGTNIHVMELFHGPTLSFKDIAMGFLVRVMDHFLAQRGEHLSLILATTGDTGPAAAHAAAACTTLDCYPLFPLGMISEEQQRQMTCLDADNVMAVGVNNCKDGGDDLDIVVARLFADSETRGRLHLSSVNSVNWCRVMFQSVHFIYGYLKTVETVGEPIAVSVPSGAFGNMFGGWLAREMGLPVSRFICSVNANQTLYRAFTQGIFSKEDLIPTVSSAIDIVVPYNFWRFLYFNGDRDSEKLAAWMDEFQATGKAVLDPATRENITKGFVTESIDDPTTLDLMATLYREKGYLADPHGAVALAGARAHREEIPEEIPILCMATAHPAKFPDIIARALDRDPNPLPEQAGHPSLEAARNQREKMAQCDLQDLEAFLVSEISRRQNK